jgi:hypothetical protein
MFFRMFALAAGCALLVGCGQDRLTALETVRLAVVASADHGGKVLATEMTQEVTTVPPWRGDSDGRGSALLTVNRGQEQVCWHLYVSSITLPAASAHIHKAAPGARGAIVVALTAPDAAGLAAGCVTGLSVELLDEILQQPEAFYVNVHTSDYPSGAVRGQLER